MSTKPKKYIFVNGVMKLNPEYQETKTITSEHHLKSLSSSSSSKQNQNSSNVAPLAIISNFNDIEEAKQSDGSSEIQLPLSTTNAINFMMSETYSNQYSVAQENNLFDGLCNYFTMYEVPIGLISRLLEIRNYRLNFMIDDSGSMGSQTDVTYGEATDHVRHGHQGNAFMTRWEEAENRLHIIIDILAYIPAKDIQISFMNNRDVKISLTHYGKTPEQFQLEYHSSISEIFHRLRLGGTPTLQTLRNGFEEASHHEEPTLHYLFTDGVPSDSTVDNLKSFIKNRAHPEKNPLTLISCTNEDSECEWMKEIEEVAPFTSEVDDYHDEKEEVLHDQGPAFPFTKGFWLLCNLISAISPDDLDALDENVPLSKFTLDELFGRVHNEREYEYYWSHNPHSKRYQNKYHQFLTEPAPSRRFIPKEERSQRKKDRCVIM